MSQSQLAMLVGVSRQSVTKWEAETSYPEMDKLLTLCEVFNCTLDELVRDDLTNRIFEAGRVVPAAAPPTDICGYSEHVRRRIWQIPTGVALIIFGMGADSLTQGLEASLGHEPSALGALLLVAAIIAGSSLLISSFMRQRQFKAEHPFIENFYSQGEKDAANRHKAVGIVIGIAIVIAAPLAPTLLNSFGVPEPVYVFAWWVLAAVGIWMIIASIMIGRSVDIERYNMKAKDVKRGWQANASNAYPKREEEVHHDR